MDSRSRSKNEEQIEYVLELSTEITADQSYVTFLFSGPKEEVKKIVRDALYGGILCECLYKKDENFENRIPGGTQYGISIGHGDFTNLTNMLWYIAKITGRIEDENQLMNMFSSVNAYTTFMKGEKCVTARLSWILREAALAAKEKIDQPLILKERKPNDRNLWTASELQELKNNIEHTKKIEQAKKACKFGLFAVALTGAVAIGTEVYKRYSMP